jgi:hypothetical protein
VIGIDEADCGRGGRRMSEIGGAGQLSRSHLRRFVDRGARWIFGLFYAAVGVAILIFAILGSASQPPQPTPEAQAFMDALSSTGSFLNPLVAGTYIAGGLALVWQRTAPLGVALLAPPVAIIFWFHMNLSHQYYWGTLNAVWLLALAWAYRRAFVPLWSYHDAGAAGRS